MPTYEYLCPDCNKTYEKFQSISSEPHIKCPDCNKKIGRKINGGTGIIFKGSGFYITDYKKKENKKNDKQKNVATSKKTPKNKTDSGTKPKEKRKKKKT